MQIYKYANMFLKKYGNCQLKKSEESLPEKDGFSEQKFPRNLSEGYLLIGN